MNPSNRAKDLDHIPSWHELEELFTPTGLIGGHILQYAQSNLFYSEKIKFIFVLISLGILIDTRNAKSHILKISPPKIKELVKKTRYGRRFQ